VISIGNIRRWSLFALACAALALLMMAGASFALTYKARGDAAKYLRLVMSLRIGTPYDVVAKELHDAGLPVMLSDDCHQECTLSFHVDDRWLYELHLAPSVGFNGRLDFRNEALVYKKTSMGEDVMVWTATVMEDASLTSHAGENADSLGNIRRMHVFLSASDFTENRQKAYAFNVACIGSIRGCKAVDYLPAVEEPEHTSPK
jgi:hypothetical protein